jgi:hypothetical protein
MINNAQGGVNDSRMFEAALELAQNGWRVFPCEPEGPDAKAPWINYGHHGATQDADVIRKMVGRTT